MKFELKLTPLPAPKGNYSYKKTHKKNIILESSEKCTINVYYLTLMLSCTLQQECGTLHLSVLVIRLPEQLKYSFLFQSVYESTPQHSN